MQLKRIFKYWSIFLVILLLSACKAVKYVPENEYLLSDITLNIDDKNIDKNELKTYLKQKPNTKIFGFWRFHLGLYNLSGKKKENSWLRRIGEAPVIYNAFQTEKSKIELQRLLRNKGYYHAIITDTVIFKPNKKVAVEYNVQAKDPFKIQTYEKIARDDSIAPFLVADSISSTVKVNDIFNTDRLSIESQRLLRNIQNQGFYNTTKSSIYFEADTSRTPERVDLKLIVDKELIEVGTDTLGYRNHSRYSFRNFYYLTDFESQRNLFSNNTTTETKLRDTLQIGNNYIVYSGHLQYKPELLINANHINDKGYYNADLVDRTYNELFTLRLFKLVNIRFVETTVTDSIGNPTLDCIIQLTPSVKQSYSVSVEGTNSLGNLGVAGNLGYQHKNLFRGGEVFDVNFLGATEKHSYGKGDSARTFNSLELGVNTKLTIPKFIAPFKSKQFFKYSTPQTFLDLAYNYQRRPDYTRSIIRGSYGYQWKSGEYTSHRINLIDLNLVKMFSLDSSFVAGIENYYIKSSYIDHSISAFIYTYIYNTQNLQKKSNYKYFRTTFETSGNGLYAIGKIFNRPSYLTDSLSGQQYHFLSTPFAQYFKTDFEFRKGIIIDRYNAFVFRTYGGIAVPYGNSVQIPFERKFFSGGANSIRAWQIRTLGPGSYRASPNEFPNQSGDVKLELNAEYRFVMFGPLEGALFIDSGNVWSLKDNRPGTEFDISRFYKEMAIGSGFGLRYDFSYVIFRIDLGIKLHDPSLPMGKRWVSANQFFENGNYNFAFAIGYPF